MLSLTHAAIGGAVGTLASSPVIAFGLGIASHLIIDKIPHFWPKKVEYQFAQILLDAVLSLAALITIYFFVGQQFDSPILWGAAGGVFVDFMLVVVFKVHPILWNSKLRVWHESRQPHKNSLVYLSTDLIQIIIGFMIITFAK